MSDLDPRTIRAFADGELPAEEAEAVRVKVAADADLASRVRFEQQLRERTSAVMGASPAVPDALRERIAALSAPQPVATITEEGRAWSRNPARINLAAVAAVLVLVAGAILFGIFGPQIDRVGTLGVQEQLVTDTARYVDGEHSLCATDPRHRHTKLQWTDPETAAAHMSSHLGGCAIQLPDLSAVGYEFIGCGPCAMPGSDPSGHMLFVNVEKRTAASVFLVPEHGQFGGLDEKIEAAGCSRTVNQRCDGRVRYFACFCDPADAPQLLQAIEASLSACGDHNVR